VSFMKEGVTVISQKHSYLSVGIDIGADFSLMAIALPTAELIGRPYKILHSSQRSVQGAIDRIFELMKQHELPAQVYMESTGIYHFPLYYKLRDAGLDAFILNPIVTHANRGTNIRKVHNDKFDAQRIALLGLRPDLKTSIVPDDATAAIKALLREYHAMKKEASMYICRLKNQLRQAFPQFLPIFSKVNGKAAMVILYEYTTPESILSAGESALARAIRTAARGRADAEGKALRLIQAATEAMSFGHGNSGIFFLIRHYVEMIRLLDAQTERIMEQVRRLVSEQNDSLLSRQVKLLETIPGVGFLSAVTLVSEIGDFAAFKRPKQLYSYFGLDPAVNQSGNYTGTEQKISKRGSPFARQCFYVLAIQAVSLRQNGSPKNPVLRAYYLEKCKSKAKMTALGAIMHKLCNLVFAILRDEKPFVLTTPAEHRAAYLRLTKTAA